MGHGDGTSLALLLCTMQSALDKLADGCIHQPVVQLGAVLHKLSTAMFLVHL